MIYGYCRISTPKQSIERQVRNILNEYKDAYIVKEIYSGKSIHRPEWDKLMKKVSNGDTIIFDSVSRMSRNADDGIATYFELYEKNIKLVFLKEHYIDTDVYSESIKDRLALTGTEVDEIFIGLNNYFRKLAEKQIGIAFEQSQKEVDDLRQRTREGITTAKLNGKRIGTPEGSSLITKKSISAKEVIKKHSKSFGGNLNDLELIKLIGISRNSFYKYKRELLN